MSSKFLKLKSPPLLATQLCFCGEICCLLYTSSVFYSHLLLLFSLEIVFFCIIQPLTATSNSLPDLTDESRCHVDSVLIKFLQSLSSFFLFFFFIICKVFLPLLVEVDWGSNCVMKERHDMQRWSLAVIIPGMSRTRGLPHGKILICWIHIEPAAQNALFALTGWWEGSKMCSFTGVNYLLCDSKFAPL